MGISTAVRKPSATLETGFDRLRYLDLNVKAI
jgi:hypothetical protein